MKKYRLTAVLLVLLCLPGFLVPAAASAPATTGSGSALLDAMHVDAAAAILIDANTGEILYEQEAHTRRYPASITKVMTALLVLEAVGRNTLSLDQVITAGPNLHTGIGTGGSTADLKEGEQLPVLDLLYSVLLPSANEACNVLAEAVSGTIPAFVAQMNQRASELGMKDTHFANTHGYHDPEHYTTAYDISLLCQEVMKYPVFREIVSSTRHTLPATNAHESRTLHSTNALVSTWYVREYYYSEATGIKTGSTPEAGYCLASAATRGQRDLIAVVMGGKNYKEDAESNYFKESSDLLKWGFDNFSLQSIIDTSEVGIAEIPVTLSTDRNYVTVHPAHSIQVTLPKDMDIASFERKFSLPAQIEAPVTAGQKLGSVTITYRGKSYGTVDLLANDTVSRSELLYRLDQLQRLMDQFWVKALLAAAAVLILVLSLRRALFGKRRSYHNPHREKTYSGSRYKGRRR
ncbi:MAG: D-alanyl-D-alanine carboxypeptidase [Oscillospiraceae bacterium]|nr:D-alanyl-D-alanine carboxypeptidase [Oscillospiraceae bacterium]